jgi:hypothetical protein
MPGASGDRCDGTICKTFGSISSHGRQARVKQRRNWISTQWQFQLFPTDVLADIFETIHLKGILDEVLALLVKQVFNNEPGAAAVTRLSEIFLLKPYAWQARKSPN